MIAAQIAEKVFRSYLLRNRYGVDDGVTLIHVSEVESQMAMDLIIPLLEEGEQSREP